MWYDILVYDFIYKWIPINIKTTTTLTSDNTANMSMCVYAYTDESLDLYKSYKNGVMSTLLTDKLKTKSYNKIKKKDYYFLILNKNNFQDIIINSVKGLSFLTSNINNLPFQVCWNKNREFSYDKIENKIEIFLKCLKKSKKSWKETFIYSIKSLHLE
jgi:hypothetical protein